MDNSGLINEIYELWNQAFDEPMDAEDLVFLNDDSSIELLKALKFNLKMTIKNKEAQNDTRSNKES